MAAARSVGAVSSLVAIVATVVAGVVVGVGDDGAALSTGFAASHRSPSSTTAATASDLGDATGACSSAAAAAAVATGMTMVSFICGCKRERVRRAPVRALEAEVHNRAPKN